MSQGILQAALHKKETNWGRSVRRNSMAHVSSNALDDSRKLVTWTLRRNIVSSSLSGATQLLLLAHTPVSRKVFQFFHCRDVGGRRLLRADYNVNCQDPEYNAFMALVIAVLMGFTIALPATLSFYIIHHRKDLYSTAVHEKIGWLYDPYVRGAEWWQIHDVLMKMVLTGLLIYIPPASRAGIAAILCMLAIANLNYFHPHKNKVLFWLTQLSFMTTGAKYVMALLLSAGSAKNSEGSYCNSFSTFETCVNVGNEQTCAWGGGGVCTSPLIGNILITLDVVFMASSLLAVPIAVCLVKYKFDKSNLDYQKNSVEVHPTNSMRMSPTQNGTSEPTTANGSHLLSLNTLNAESNGESKKENESEDGSESETEASGIWNRSEIETPAKLLNNVMQDPEITEIKQIILDLVKTPTKMRSIFQKLDREHSHGLTNDEFYLFVNSACKKVGKELNARIFKLLWLCIEHHKVNDHDELEEIAIEKWLFTEVINVEEGKATTESNVTSSHVESPERGQGNLGHHHRSRGRHGGLADQMADNAAHGNHMDI